MRVLVLFKRHSSFISFFHKTHFKTFRTSTTLKSRGLKNAASGLNMGVEKLPAEILQDVFGLLHKMDVYTCLLMNKKWIESVVVLFYEKIELDGEYVYRHREKVFWSKGIIKYGKFAKELDIRRDYILIDPHELYLDNLDSYYPQWIEAKLTMEEFGWLYQICQACVQSTSVIVISWFIIWIYLAKLTTHNT